MCFFSKRNTNVNSPAYKAGLVAFECGKCPECLQKRSNVWALRCVYEAREHAHNCMCTLTYDSFARDINGNLIYDSCGKPVENPVDPTLKVSKRHCQLFIKRLRKKYPNLNIKYFLSAEYGSRTHRAHYHVILFGVRFPDLVPYKKSDRGNQIYFSHILTTLWGHGICTVDSINIHGGIARYCSKYCAKERTDETFSLFSHYIGLNGMLEHFNGTHYMLEGREHPIPRIVWQHFITNKYKNIVDFHFSYKYVNRDYTKDYYTDTKYNLNKIYNENYRNLRDNDLIYQKYIAYWREKIERINIRRPSDVNRLLALPSKYASYVTRSLRYLTLRNDIGLKREIPPIRYTCRYTSCHNTASDTKLIEWDEFIIALNELYWKSWRMPFKKNNYTRDLYGLNCDSPPQFDVDLGRKLEIKYMSLVEVPTSEFDLPYHIQYSFEF